MSTHRDTPKIDPLAPATKQGTVRSMETPDGVPQRTVDGAESGPPVPARWGIVAEERPMRSPLRTTIVAVLALCLAAVATLPWLIGARTHTPASVNDEAFEALVAYAQGQSIGTAVPATAATLLTAAREVRTPTGTVLVLAGTEACWALDLADLATPPTATHAALCE